MFQYNSNLYNYNKYYNLLSNLFLKNNLPNSILINGCEGIGKKTFILNFFANIQIFFESEKKVKFQFCKEKISSNKIYKLINNTYMNFKILQKNEKNIITVDDVRNLINFLNKSSINDQPRFVAIFNIENLNNNASNALLKILENPPSNCFIFLLKNQEYIIPNTIASRCHKFNIKFSSYENNEIYKKLLIDFNIGDYNYDNIFSDFDTAGSKINRILYLNNSKLSSFNILNVINYCFNKYIENKDLTSLKYFLFFLRTYYLNKFKTNFFKFHHSYELIYEKINKSVNFNNDISFLNSFLKKM